MTSLARDIKRVELQVADRVTHREMDDVKRDVADLETKLDRIIQTQLANQRTANLQLIGIVVTLILAGFGALT